MGRSRQRFAGHFSKGVLLIMEQQAFHSVISLRRPRRCRLAPPFRVVESTMPTLVPCISCQRHAWSTEPACPFCGGGLAAPRPPRAFDARRDHPGLVLAASLALTACGSGQPGVDNPDGGDPVEQPPPDVVAMYGAPAPEPDISEPQPDDPDHGAAAPEYGAPMPPDDPE
jgi:hypothetical protein